MTNMLKFKERYLIYSQKNIVLMSYVSQLQLHSSSYLKWLTQALLNDDERDTTEVPKQTLNAILLYHFYFHYGVRYLLQWLRGLGLSELQCSEPG